MTTVLKITEDDFDAALDIAVAALRSGEVFIYPTDTVYGIGGDATSEDVVRKIHGIKKITDRRPMSVMVPDPGMIEYYCETGIWEDIILRKYLPGPYTFVLKRQRYIPASATGKLGVRIPDSAFCRRLCQRFGKPIVSTSANITKQKPATRLDYVDKEVLDAVGLAIDGGETKYHGPSIVIDLVDRKMLREGMKEGISLLDLPEP
jgi:L-threonylcarbamoyladenylate synthase